MPIFWIFSTIWQVWDFYHKPSIICPSPLKAEPLQVPWEPWSLGLDEALFQRPKHTQKVKNMTQCIAMCLKIKILKSQGWQTQFTGQKFRTRQSTHSKRPQARPTSCPLLPLKTTCSKPARPQPSPGTSSEWKIQTFKLNSLPGIFFMFFGIFFIMWSFLSLWYALPIYGPVENTDFTSDSNWILSTTFCFIFVDHYEQ